MLPLLLLLSLFFSHVNLVEVLLKFSSLTKLLLHVLNNIFWTFKKSNKYNSGGRASKSKSWKPTDKWTVAQNSFLKCLVLVAISASAKANSHNSYQLSYCVGTVNALKFFVQNNPLDTAFATSKWTNKEWKILFFSPTTHRTSILSSRK